MHSIPLFLRHTKITWNVNVMNSWLQCRWSVMSVERHSIPAAISSNTSLCGVVLKHKNVTPSSNKKPNICKMLSDKWISNMINAFIGNWNPSTPTSELCTGRTKADNKRKFSIFSIWLDQWFMVSASGW